MGSLTAVEQPSVAERELFDRAFEAPPRKAAPTDPLAAATHEVLCEASDDALWDVVVDAICDCEKAQRPRAPRAPPPPPLATTFVDPRAAAAADDGDGDGDGFSDDGGDEAEYVDVDAELATATTASTATADDDATAESTASRDDEDPRRAARRRRRARRAAAAATVVALEPPPPRPPPPEAPDEPPAAHEPAAERFRAPATPQRSRSLPAMTSKFDGAFSEDEASDGAATPARPRRAHAGPATPPPDDDPAALAAIAERARRGSLRERRAVLPCAVHRAPAAPKPRPAPPPAKRPSLVAARAADARRRRASAARPRRASEPDQPWTLWDDGDGDDGGRHDDDDGYLAEVFAVGAARPTSVEDALAALADEAGDGARAAAALVAAALRAGPVTRALVDGLERWLDAASAPPSPERAAVASLVLQARVAASWAAVADEDEASSSDDDAAALPAAAHAMSPGLFGDVSFPQGGSGPRDWTEARALAFLDAQNGALRYDAALAAAVHADMRDAAAAVLAAAAANAAVAGAARAVEALCRRDDAAGAPRRARALRRLLRPRTRGDLDAEEAGEQRAPLAVLLLRLGAVRRAQPEVCDGAARALGVPDALRDARGGDGDGPWDAAFRGWLEEREPPEPPPSREAPPSPPPSREAPPSPPPSREAPPSPSREEPPAFPRRRKIF